MKPHSCSIVSIFLKTQSNSDVITIRTRTRFVCYNDGVFHRTRTAATSVLVPNRKPCSFTLKSLKTFRTPRKTRKSFLRTTTAALFANARFPATRSSAVLFYYKCKKKKIKNRRSVDQTPICKQHRKLSTPKL